VGELLPESARPIDKTTPKYVKGGPMP
jgi:hypothetical protein